MDNDVVIEVPHLVTSDRERIGKIITVLDRLTNKGRDDMAVLQDAFALARSLEIEEQMKAATAAFKPRRKRTNETDKRNSIIGYIRPIAIGNLPFTELTF